MAVLDTGSLMNETNTAMVGASRGYAPAGGGVTKAGGHESDAGYGVDTAGGPGGGSIPTVGQGGGASAANDDFHGGGGRGGQNMLDNPDPKDLWADQPYVLRDGSYSIKGPGGGKNVMEMVFSSSKGRQQMFGADGKPIGPAR